MGRPIPNRLAILPALTQDAQWNQKYTLFKEMVTLCISVLPASHTVSSSLPSLEEARAGRRLYLRFVKADELADYTVFNSFFDCEHSIAMFGLAKRP